LIAAHRRLVDGAALQKSAAFSSIDLVQQGYGGRASRRPRHLQQGYARIARGEYGEAIAEFRRAAATDPLIVDPFSRSSSMTQAVAALRQGRTADARSSLERFDGRARFVRSAARAGPVYWTDAQYDKSVEALTTAIQKNPRDERSRLALSRVLSSAGRGSDAERALHEMLQILPDSALAHAWLAAGYEDAGRVADARQEFEIAADSVTAGRGAFFAVDRPSGCCSGRLPPVPSTPCSTQSPPDRTMRNPQAPGPCAAAAGSR
jgi:Flp pilus assembly protein TadD